MKNPCTSCHKNQGCINRKQSSSLNSACGIYVKRTTLKNARRFLEGKIPPVILYKFDEWVKEGAPDVSP